MKTFAVVRKRPSPCSMSPRMTFAFSADSRRSADMMAVRQILRGPRIQAKLTIGAPNDIFEQEADRVADEVMRMPGPQAQAAPTCNDAACLKSEEGTTRPKPLADPITPMVQRRTEAEEKEALMQADTLPNLTPEVASAIVGIKDGGRPLPVAERAFFEPRFGRDFGHVRVHVDDRAGGLAAAVNAKAFTLGQDIVFGARAYRPETDSGRRLLAHELTHVLQQNLRTIRRLTITPVHLLKGSCGKVNKMWDFVLGGPASGDGYLVQHVQVFSQSANCPGTASLPNPLPNPKLEYWEAWPVPFNATHSTDRQSIPLKKGGAVAQTLVFTDTSRIDQSWPNQSGAYLATGDLRFYLKSVTGDLGSANQAPETGSPNSGTWGPSMVAATGGLTGSNTRPSWWSSAPTEGPATRKLAVSWRCCGDGNDFNNVVDHP